MKSSLAVLLLSLLLALVAVRSPAQSHLAVDLKDPVYTLLELGELKGLLDRLSAVRPYSLSEILRLLDRMEERRELLGPREQEILEQTRARLGTSPSGLRYGSVRTGGEKFFVQAGVDVRSELRVNAGAPEAWTLESAVRAYVRGDLASWLSYAGSAGGTFDRLGYDDTVPLTVPVALRYPAFVPYGFSKQWDAYHIGFGEPRIVYDDNLPNPMFSYDLGMDIGAQFKDDAITVRAAYFRREWGLGDGSLTLSGTARPVLAAEVHARLAPWIAFHHLTGGLSNWRLEPDAYYSYPEPATTPVKPTYQKLFTIQRMELFPLPWLYASASSTVIGARRLELGYMAPLIFALIWQNTFGDLDNVGVGVDLAATLPRWGRVYFSFYADEMADFSPIKMFTRPRNMFALQAGLKVPIPGLPFTGLTFQYTKIEPFTYAHYPTWNPDFRLPVDTSYTHDGENLAYALYPNSDEFLVKLWSLPVPRLKAALEYRLIRHGDNPDKNPGDMAILGRPEAYLDYAIPGGLDAYPNKDFLHDGLYDFNHIVTLTGSYALPWFPATVSLSYSFVYTFWDPNSTGLTAPPVQVRNILALSLTVFR